MKRILFSTGLIVFSGLVFTALYSGYGEKPLSVVLRWGEIIIALSFTAGLIKFLTSEFRKIRKGRFSRWNSVVILISFFITFLAGILNINESKYTFNNIVRERPSYLYEVSNIIIDDDSYMGKFPARKKLALYISARVSPYFYPTDEILKDANTTREQFRNIVYKENSSSAAGVFSLNEDDEKTIKPLEKKVRAVSIDSISKMLPVSGELREWFANSFYILVSKTKKDEMRDIGKNYYIRDLNVNGQTYENTGSVLTEWFEKTVERREGKNLEIKDAGSYYSDFIGVSGVLEMISASFKFTSKEAVSKKATAEIYAAFLKTGLTSSSPMKGFIRWIYRSVFDPLFSTLMMLLFFSMMITAFKKLDFRNYSYFVVSVSVCITIIGFMPFTALPDQGFQYGTWMMNVVAAPVFKAFIVGTGAGFMFYIFDSLYETYTFIRQGVKNE